MLITDIGSDQDFTVFNQVITIILFPPDCKNNWFHSCSFIWHHFNFYAQGHGPAVRNNSINMAAPANSYMQE